MLVVYFIFIALGGCWFVLYVVHVNINFCDFQLSLHQDVSHVLDVLISIIWCYCSRISTRVIVVRVSSCTKPDSRVTAMALVFIVCNDTNSCFSTVTDNTKDVEPFLVTSALQGSLRANEGLPCVTTQ